MGLGSISTSEKWGLLVPPQSCHVSGGTRRQAWLCDAQQQFWGKMVSVLVENDLGIPRELLGTFLSRS